MKLFACYCRDTSEAAALREREMQSHLAHVETNIESYAVAGPLKDGDATCGSLLVVTAQDARAARAFIESDPYFRAGVWSSIEVLEFHAVAGDWVGGAAWKR